MTDLTERDVEERLRAGLARRAADAPAARPVLDALAWNDRAGRRRTRPAGLWPAAAAVVAAAALGLTFAVHAMDAQVTPATRSRAVPPRLTYDLGWVPVGFHEWYREASPDDTLQIRTWSGTPNDSTTGPAIEFENVNTVDPNVRRRVDVTAGHGDAVLADGRTANVTATGPGDASVMWNGSYSQLLIVHVSNEPDALQVALHVADSVVADTDSTVVTGMAFGRLPDGLLADTVAVYGSSPQYGTSMLTASTVRTTWHTDLYVSVTSGGDNVDDGAPVVVRGRSGRYSATGGPGPHLSVRLPDGRWLHVRSQPAPGRPPLSEATLVTVANGITFTSPPDYSWLGR